MSMPPSLTTLDSKVKLNLTRAFLPSYHAPMQEESSIRQGIGMRLKVAREAMGKTQQQVADHFGVKKGTVSAWETGGGMPDAARLRALAKYYKISSDAILFEDSLTSEAMQIGAQFDNLSDAQQKMFRALWLAYFEQATSDEEVSKRMPALPGAPAPKVEAR
jgi:transcriptional regulator with XRE-family HTH domain